MANIKFGTDGWRAVVGKDFNDENVKTVTKSIGKYIFDKYGLNKKIIVGYDPRNMAFEYSQMTAKQLSEYGFNVLLSDKVIPTPVLAFNAKHLNACAVMFTASHNPPEYLGIKFIPDYAGPATSEITDELTKNLSEDFNVKSNGDYSKYDFSKDYFEHIEKLIDFNKIKTLKTNIIFDGLYAASIGYFDKLLDMNDISYDSLHMYHDVNFGGGMPEPKPKYLKELIEKVKSNSNSVGFANDGDSDRFGVINENGEYVSPNEIISILLRHLKKNKNYSGPLVKTVGASLLLNKVAEKVGVDVIETAVGFKHVGEAMRKFNPIIGGEESGGLSIQGHIPEKDGILANLLILEAMAYENKSLVELQKDLYEFVGCKFYNDRIDKKLENFDLIKPILEEYKAKSDIGDFKVSKIDTKDGVKLYFSDNSSWVLIRPSGTEPLLRIYFESDSMEKLDTLKELLEKI
ncbi:phosphoglucomutase/phosphomannomutase family protein [bacterium]|nr:phosphoglucomutase/phosphomannomutase family protein [bacterium]